jgi:hypothetical protein
MFDKIMTSGGKKGERKASTQATAYFHHLLAERVVGAPIDGFKSQWMERGSELEHRAVASYELAHECETERIGFVTTDDGRIGCSPDRFIVGRDDEALEIKAPTAAVHMSYLLASEGASQEYKVQLQGQLWVCEKQAVTIVSFYPGMPNAEFRMERDEEFIKDLAAYVRAFSGRLEDKVAEFTERGWIKAEEEEQPQAGGFFDVTDEDVAALLAHKFPQGQTL